MTGYHAYEKMYTKIFESLPPFIIAGAHVANLLIQKKFKKKFSKCVKMNDFNKKTDVESDK